MSEGGEIGMIEGGLFGAMMNSCRMLMNIFATVLNSYKITDKEVECDYTLPRL